MDALPSLTATLARLAARPRGPQCTVGKLLAALPIGDADSLRAALGDDDIPATLIAMALVESGHEIAGITVRRHRNRGTGTGCKCPA